MADDRKAEPLAQDETAYKGSSLSHLEDPQAGTNTNTSEKFQRDDAFVQNENENKNTRDVEKNVAHVDLNSNLTARIENPLAGISRDQLMRDVDAFAQKYTLTDIVPDLRKGALVAQNPIDFDSMPELDADDKASLEYEILHKWHQPWQLYLTVIVCSIGAAVQGWDQTGANGANLSFPLEFGINPVPGDPNYQRNNWLVGLINSGPFLSAAVIGTWLSDPLNYYFGRRGTIFFSAIFVFLAPIGSGFTQNWPQLLICRFLLGIGLGTKAAIVPVYAAENVPALIRGGLVMSWQLWTTFGILLGLCANLILFRVGSIAWRLQLGSAFIPSIPLLVLIYFCPESPRWYMKKGRYRDAYKSLVRLRTTKLQAARDLYYISSQLTVESAIIGESNYFTRLIELFTIPRNRRASLAAFVVMIAQQMCGINIIAFYSSSVFVTAGFSERNALLVSWGFGLVNFTFAWPAVKTIDTFGRRNLLLFTFPQMAWTLLAAGLCFLIPSSSPAGIGLVALFIFLFAAFYSPGEGPVPFAYSAEVFPLSHREIGMSYAVAVNNFFAAVLSVTYFRIVAAFTITGAFGFYAGLNVVALIMIFLWLPETKQRTLEELDYIFGVPTSVHMKYQMQTALPFYVKRWIFWNRKIKLPPLYKLDRVSDKDEIKARMASRAQSAGAPSRK